MANVNTISLTGTLEGVDVREAGGKEYFALRVATMKKDRREVHKVSLWGDAVEVARQLQPGDYVCLQGALSSRAYTKDGKEQSFTEASCNVLSYVRTAPAKKEPANDGKKRPADGFEGDDDVPF